MSDYNTDVGPGLSPGLGQAPQAPPPKPTDDELFGAAFRTQNSFGSVINRINRGVYEPVPGYNPIDDIKAWGKDNQDYLRNHGTTFLGSQSPGETMAIKDEIDKARKDREAIAAGGWNGTVAGLSIGLVDPTMFLPVGNAVRMARLATIGGRSAEMGTSFAKMALMQSTAQEALLQASQPERTLSESAINIGSNTILAALIGAGGYALLAREGLLEKGVGALDAARVKLSEHNGTLETGPEKITSSATKFDGKIYEGQTHADAYQKYIDEINKTGAQADAAAAAAYGGDGFITSTGRFVGREEAQKIAEGASQVPANTGKKPGQLYAEELKTAETGPAGNIADAVPGVQPELQPAGTGQALAAGAAPSDTRNLSPVPYGLDSIPWVGKKVSKFFPNLDAVTNGSFPAQAAVLEISEFPLLLKAHEEGQTSTRFGGPAIDRELNIMRNGLRSRTNDMMMEQWGRHLEQEGGATFMQRETGKPGGGSNKMTFDEFDAAVYDALSTGDSHEISEVATAAQWMRKEGLDPIKERALKAIDGFKETTLRPGETFAPRIWDQEKISANWNDYVSTWTDHLVAEQNVKAQAKGRIEGLAKQLSESRATIDIATTKLSKMKDDDLFRVGHEEELIRANAAHDAARKRLEEEIATWEGTSAAEAKSALKARAKAEEARSPDAKRLASADKAIDKAAKRIIESERDLSRQELKSRAEEIASRVIGTPEGRLPYDVSSGGTDASGSATDLRGHAAHREIDIPYEMAKPWLERSATKALKSYTHSVLPDALIAERFHGDPTMMSVMKDIESTYAAKRAEAGDNPAAQSKLKDAMDNDIRIVAGMRDRIRGTYAYDPNMRTLATVSQNVLKINNIVSSHGMAIASLPDFAGTTFRLGFENAFRDAWIPYSRALFDNEAWETLKAQGKELQAFGIGIDTKTASRMHAISDIDENYRAASKFERALTWASDKSFIVNLLSPLTDLQKRMAANAVSHNILRMSQAVAEGRATAKQIRDLAAGNITEAQAAKIFEQYSNNGGANVKGVLLPNLAGWTDKEARLAFQGAVARDVDIAVVTPGQEKPFFLSKPGFNLLGQYKSFSISATQRILIANLQRHDAASLQGAVLAVAMGMMAYRINTMASGKPFAPDVPTLFKEGISRGGILGIFDDANTITSKATGGKFDIYRAIGADKPLSKFVSKDAASMFLGPTYGKLQNLMQITRGISNPSQWNESDSHALRMGLLGTNYPFFPQAFDQVESGFNHAFGIPMKAKPQ